jgi:hypothetical protein
MMLGDLGELDEFVIAGARQKNPRTCRGIRVEQVLGNNPTRPWLEDTFATHWPLRSTLFIYPVLQLSNAGYKHALRRRNNNTR